MLHAIQAYRCIVKKLNTRIFEVFLSDWYVPRYLNAGHKQMASATAPAPLFCCQFSCVFPFLITLSCHAEDLNCWSGSRLIYFSVEAVKWALKSWHGPWISKWSMQAITVHLCPSHNVILPRQIWINLSDGGKRWELILLYMECVWAFTFEEAGMWITLPPTSKMREMDRGIRSVWAHVLQPQHILWLVCFKTQTAGNARNKSQIGTISIQNIHLLL